MTTHETSHLFYRPLAAALVAACVGVVATAQQPAPPQAAPRQPDPAAVARQAEINKRPDTPGTGRFPAMKEEVASLPRHVVYRPKDLAGLGRTKLGVVAWGNGGCSDDCFTYFRGWLIAQGETVFYNALKDPETLEYIEDGEDVECQHMLNVAEWAYEIKTGNDTIPFRVRKFWFDEEISGEEWDEDTVDAKYPKLAAKFSE